MLRRLELFAVQMHHLGVRLQQIVTAQIARDAGEFHCGRHEINAVRLLAYVPRLIDARPELDAIAEALEQHLRKVAQIVHDLRIRPAAQQLDGLRQLPVVDADHRSDVVAQALVDQVAVVADALLVDAVREAAGQNAWPRDREAVDVDAQLLHHLHVATPLCCSENKCVSNVTNVIIALDARRSADSVARTRDRTNSSRQIHTKSYMLMVYNVFICAIIPAKLWATYKSAPSLHRTHTPHRVRETAR